MKRSKQTANFKYKFTICRFRIGSDWIWWTNYFCQIYDLNVELPKRFWTESKLSCIGPINFWLDQKWIFITEFHFSIRDQSNYDRSKYVLDLYLEGHGIRLKLWKMAFAFYNFVSVVCIIQVRTFYWKHVTFWQGREHSSREVRTVADCAKFRPKNMNLNIQQGLEIGGLEVHGPWRYAVLNWFPNLRPFEKIWPFILLHMNCCISKHMCK